MLAEYDKRFAMYKSKFELAKKKKAKKKAEVVVARVRVSPCGKGRAGRWWQDDHLFILLDSYSNVVSVVIVVLVVHLHFHDLEGLSNARMSYAV